MYQNELYHHGVKGQQWGIRRFQNADGSLTSQGRQRIQSRVTRLDKKKSILEEKKSKIDSKISNGSRLSIKKSKWDNKSARLARKIDKVRQKIEKNNDLLNLKMSDITKNFRMPNDLMAAHLAAHLVTEQTRHHMEAHNTAIQMQNAFLDTHMLNTYIHNTFM